MVSKDKEYKNIKIHILKKLYDQRMWLHKHTNINNLPKGLPTRLRQSKILKRVIKDLLKKSLLIGKPTHYGLEISLNIKKKKEIEEIIEGDL